jgi:hypothetical protein
MKDEIRIQLFHHCVDDVLSGCHTRIAEKLLPIKICLIERAGCLFTAFQQSLGLCIRSLPGAGVRAECLHSLPSGDM